MVPGRSRVHARDAVRLMRNRGACTIGGQRGDGERAGLLVMGARSARVAAMVPSPSEQARLARAEIEKIVASLPVDELARLVRLGREVLDETTTEEPPAFGS